MLLTYPPKYLKFIVMRLSLVICLLIGAYFIQSEDSVGGTPITEKPIVIAVIDTGFGFANFGHQAKLCKYGHKDFTDGSELTRDYGTVAPLARDVHGHGTNVVGLIERSLTDEDNYCIVVIKFWTQEQSTARNVGNTIKAFRYATNIKATIVNYSAGGPNETQAEKDAVIDYLNKGGKIVAAAGNEKENLDNKKNKYFPAQYDDRIIVVGNVDANGVRDPSSNWGTRVSRTEVGVDQDGYGIIMTGTSQATAVATGKIVKGMLDARHKGN